MKIELYIDKQLCEISDPNKFAVYLKRQLYNPTELNTKDAQASYTLSLPASTVNNRIFGFANVEEVRGKFERLYDAELIVNGIRIFEGKFKLSEIDSFSYKGNLGIPAVKSVKDIFGDKNMNQLGEWTLKTQFADPDTGKMVDGLNFISYYNRQENPDCIFPFVLYGLLPRNPDKETLSDKEGITEEFKKAYKKKFKQILDDNVRIGIEDMPPSVNCLKMLKNIFREANYNLGGNAFQDERLRRLYVSYKNPNDYAQQWNWGDLGTMHIDGEWTMAHRKAPNDYSLFERRIDQNSDEKGEYYNINLFDSNRLEINNLRDSGTNITYSIYKDDYGDQKDYKRHSLHLVIPQSGYYKVKLSCDEFRLGNDNAHLQLEDDYQLTGNKFTSMDQRHYRQNSFRRSRYELLLMRDYGTGDFNNVNIVGLYNSPQFPQKHFADKTQFPKYYPAEGGALVVDPSVNQNFVCGLHWGKHWDESSMEWNPKDSYPRPKDEDEKKEENNEDYIKANYMFIANGFSWDKKFSQKSKILCAYDSAFYDKITGKEDETGNYYCWGLINAPEPPPEPGEEPGGGLGGGIDPEPEPGEDNDEMRPDWIEWKIKKRYARFLDREKMNRIGQTRNRGRYDNTTGDGYVECIIWLERGERLALCVAADMADLNSGKRKEWDCWIALIDKIKFSLDIVPFRTDIEWCNFKSNGDYLNEQKDEKDLLKWNDEPNFRTGNINLMDFLPSEMRVDDWIENFCKAFNLMLVQTDEKTFELNIRQNKLMWDTSRLIDLDTRTHCAQRTNQTLSLPQMYRIGFSNDKDEEGYYRAEKEGMPQTGGGEFHTGSHEANTVEQTSAFSYNWYKQLYQVNPKPKPANYNPDDIQPLIKVPVITNHELWDYAGKEDYADMVKKLYFDKAQRFWFHSGTHTLMIGNPLIYNPYPDDGTTPTEERKRYVDVALVSNNRGQDGGLILTYENRPDSIMRNYFFLLDNSYNYTEVETYLSPEEYNRIAYSPVQFNGDLYRVVSVDGYDPACHKKARLRLIRKIY